MNDFQRKRWLCYGASLLLVLCAGLQYSLSVFQIPLDEKFGWGIPKIAFSYSILCIAETFVVIFFAGKLRARLGIQKFLILGSLFFGGGILLCAFISSSIFELYLYQGVMVGIGHAILYPCLTSYVIQLVPERAGLVSGLVVGTYACGPLIWAPLAASISSSAGDVSRAFIVIGLIMLVALISLSLLLREPPEGFSAEVMASAERRRRSVAIPARDIPRRGMVRMPIFYLFYLSFFIPILGGMMVLTQGATIFEYELRVSATLAATLLGALSLCNAAGRVTCAAIFDRLNPLLIMKLLFLSNIAAFSGMIFFRGSPFFVAAACLCLFGFGGFAALLPPMTSKLFGVKYLTENFGLVFTIYSIAGFLAPVLITNLREWSGNYTLSFSIILLLSAFGLFFSTRLERMLARQTQDAAPLQQEASL